MKTLILILSLTFLSTNAFAQCKMSPEMGKNFIRCENEEAVCYSHIEHGLGGIGANLTEAPISCFKK